MNTDAGSTRPRQWTDSRPPLTSPAAGASAEAWHVIVAGRGPAGLLVSAALSARGLRVLAIGPDAAWTARYGAWVDELARPDVGLGDVFDRVWPRALAHMTEAAPRPIDRAYGRIDRARLRCRLETRLRGFGGRLESGHVLDIAPSAGGAQVRWRTCTGCEHVASALAVIDATGAQARFVAPSRPATAFQTAFGVEVTLDAAGEQAARRAGWASDAMTLMDYRPIAGATRPGRGPEPATFLYAMPLGDGRWFFEETSLVARPRVSLETLEQRLWARLAGRGVEPVAVHDVERCVIPTDRPLPALGQPIVGFGSAATMVHPATGYQLAHAARMATVLAQAIGDGVEAGLRGQDLAASAWAALWPKRARRMHRVFEFGAEWLMAATPSETRRFFGAFFQNGPALVRGFLSRTATWPQLLRALAGTWRRLPGRDAWRLLVAGAAEALRPGSTARRARAKAWPAPAPTATPALPPAPIDPRTAGTALSSLTATGASALTPSKELPWPPR